jgi:hypothetical protein
MKKILFISLSLATLTFLVYSCVLQEDEDHHYKIYFENRWDKSIYIRYNVDWHWYDSLSREWVTSYSEEPLYETRYCSKIQPGGIDSELMKLRDYYEYELQDGDSVVISVFDAEQPDKKDSECFLVRYHLSEEDLRKIDFYVCYPPTEAMKDFYMKPSYDEVTGFVGESWERSR